MSKFQHIVGWPNLSYWRCLPAGLEAPYETASGAQTDMRTRNGLVIGLSILAAGLFTDYFVTPATFERALQAKALCGTLMLAAIASLSYACSPSIRRTLLIAANASVVLAILFIGAGASGHVGPTYLLMSAFYAIGCNCVMGFRIDDAVQNALALAVTYAIAGAATVHAGFPHMDHAFLYGMVALMTLCIALTCFIPLENERYRRAAFLSEHHLTLAQADLEHANRQLKGLLSRDALTGVHNRRYLDDTLPQKVEHCLQNSAPLGLLMIDVDHFKAYNDLLGHQAGDDCLRQVAQCLEKNLRSTDSLCRYGGEEFAVLLPNADRTTAYAAAERLRQAVQALALPHPREPAGIVTVSIGCISTTPRAVGDGVSMLNAADEALYDCKRAGRNCARLTRQESFPAPAAAEAADNASKAA